MWVMDTAGTDVDIFQYVVVIFKVSEYQHCEMGNTEPSPRVTTVESGTDLCRDGDINQLQDHGQLRRSAAY
ncbi:hypothetical protein F2P81_005289 [Scophthalmus maximus]|uniref:Uncharacterized protein n=1 Tax=Scophthalmus maximus TaxID=52904 RepID=A0A6A4T626_SCOMX|nr:hypothetical protein F2P81_005289 [Scophthalmus maximus]